MLALFQPDVLFQYPESIEIILIVMVQLSLQIQHGLVN